MLDVWCIDLGHGRLFLLGGERWRRQVGVYLVEDEDLDFGLGLLLLPETVDLREALRDRRQQVAALLFDALPLRLGERRKQFSVR